MKKLFLTLLTIATLLVPCNLISQQINLGPTNVQVKGLLGQANGGFGSNPNIPTNCGGPTNALIWNTTTNQFGCNTFSSSGSVTSVSASSSYMFSLNVSDPTTTPAITTTFGNTTNQVFVGTGSGTGAWTTVPSCNGGTNALTFNNTAQTFGCTATAGTTTNALTFNTSGGVAAGSSFNGSVPETIDYHSVGAPSVAGTNATGTWGINISGTATALQTAPTQCTPSTQFAYGIAANGNAACQLVYYQTIDEAGSPLTQEPILNFDGTVVGTNASGQTNVGLPNTGTAGTYTNPASFVTDAQGRVTSVTNGPSGAWSSGSNSNGSWVKDPTGHIHQYGHLASETSGSCNLITFPTEFTSAVGIVPATADDFASGSSIEHSIVISPSHGCTGITTTNMQDWVSSSGNGVFWMADGN
jgi:hypothetical protein